MERERERAKHRLQNKWFFHTTILNVTNSKPSLDSYYENFYHTQNVYTELNWQIDTKDDRNFNYSIFINDIEVLYDSRYYYDSYIYFNFNSYPEFNNTIMSKNEIRLEIIDDNGDMTVNEFDITTVGNNVPNIQTFSSDCINYNHNFVLWESQEIIINVEAWSNEDDLERIVILLGNMPYHTILNPQRYTEYGVPINSFKINSMRNEDGYFPFESLDFRALAVSNVGKNSDPYNYNQIYYSFKHYEYDTVEEISKQFDSGRNIEVFEIEDDHNSNIQYSLTLVSDLFEETGFSAIATTPEVWERTDAPWYHCLNQNDNSECKLFGETEIDNQYIQGGFLFWVNYENESAVQFPIIAKIMYPEELNPTDLNNIDNLLFLHWIDKCKSGELSWYIYKNKTVSEDRDETLKKVSENSLEILLYEPGLYAFGIECKEGGRFSDEFYISGFPMGLFLSFIGIAILTLIKQKNKK